LNEDKKSAFDSHRAKKNRSRNGFKIY
jgi:hypothetical protein